MIIIISIGGIITFLLYLLISVFQVYSPIIIAVVALTPFVILYVYKIEPQIATRKLSNPAKFVLCARILKELHPEYYKQERYTLPGGITPFFDGVIIEKEQYDQFFDNLEKSWNNPAQNEYRPISYHNNVIDFPRWHIARNENGERCDEYWKPVLNELGKKYQRKFGISLTDVFDIKREWHTRSCYFHLEIDWNVESQLEQYDATTKGMKPEKKLKRCMSLLEKEDRT